MNNNCLVTVLCNNFCDPLIEDSENPLVEYRRTVMRGLIGEHGLGYHVDLGDKVLLFDVGGIQKTFMHNIHH
ncbi:MAG: hypothetical protein ACTSRA_23270, partial [Promethearchaeota archaeon]